MKLAQAQVTGNMFLWENNSSLNQELTLSEFFTQPFKFY